MTFFNSFFLGGFECADHINRSGERVNLLKETGHDIRVDEDYRNLVAMGIRTVREGICWSIVEPQPYVYDFSTIAPMLDAAARYGIQQVWDLCHFGYPDGIYPTHPHFCDRFVGLCEAFALFHKRRTTDRLYVVPINEISFLSWHSGDVRGTVPFATNSGFDMKYHLCKAAIRGIRKLKEVNPSCIVVLVEPLVWMHAADVTDTATVATLNEPQFQAMDILLGRMCPELGGSQALADLLGFNYYWNCQWREGGGPLDWPETLAGERIALGRLLELAGNRYRKPMFLSETGHFGSGREEWILEITEEVASLMGKGIDFYGICIYPVTDRPDWDALDRYSQCGIWDLDAHKNRIPHLSYMQTIAGCQAQIAGLNYSAGISFVGT